MSPTMQLIVTIFYIVWLCAVLLLLYGIWRASTKQTQLLVKTLVDAAMQSATSAQIAAEATRELVQHIRQDKKP